jgi:hypothetical protein
MNVNVIGLVFSGPGREGDFRWMIERSEYEDALFVFNDNEEQFMAFRADPHSPSGCSAGGGNAAIRPWRCTEPPRAAGVPTGTLAAGGYPALTDHVRKVVDAAVEHAGAVVETCHYRRIIYSAADDNGTLGTGIFAVGGDVRRYIVMRLAGLARPVPGIPGS